MSPSPTVLPVRTEAALLEPLAATEMTEKSEVAMLLAAMDASPMRPRMAVCRNIATPQDRPDRITGVAWRR